MKHILTTFWKWLVDFFEYGDLVPLLVLVSAFHYAAILRDKDVLAVAVSLGLIVDLGHFRTIRAAFRYAGDDRRHRVALWLIALAMTGVSFAYHERYYQDFWLSAPIPFLIAALAWLQKVDKRAGRVTISKSDTSITKIDTSIIHALPERIHACKKCDATFTSIPELASHSRWQHNGKEKIA